MDNIEITLTSVDKAILNSYAAMVPGLSAYLGAHYEIVLHSLASLSNSVIAICNGHHTGRAVGSPITDLALQMLSEIRADRSYVTAKNYFTTKKDGTHLKSTTIPIRGERQRIIGLLCMNLYLDTPFFDVLANLMPDVPPPAKIRSSWSGSTPRASSASRRASSGLRSCWASIKIPSICTCAISAVRRKSERSLPLGGRCPRNEGG